MSNLRAVIFDLDQTLLDRDTSLELFVRWQLEAELSQEKIDEESFVNRFIELDANGQVWKDKVYSQLVGEFLITSVDAPALLESYLRNFANHCVAKAGMVEQVELLHEEGILLALVSNGRSPFQENNFQSLSIDKMFSVVLVSEACGYKKPQREIFDLAASRLGVENRKCAFVGDNPIADIRGANEADMFSIFVPAGVYGDCPEASYTLHDPSELIAVIKDFQ